MEKTYFYCKYFHISLHFCLIQHYLIKKNKIEQHYMIFFYNFVNPRKHIYFLIVKGFVTSSIIYYNSILHDNLSYNNI